MTSPLRRKRRITRRSLQRRNSREQGAGWTEYRICNLQFAICDLQFRRRFAFFLAALIAMLWMPGPAAAELQWRTGRAAHEKRVKSTSAQRFVRPNISQSSVSPAATAQQKSVFPVRPAAFEEENPQLAVASEGSARLRSIVVERDEEAEFDRSAQLPSTGVDTSPSPTFRPPGVTPPSDAQSPTTASPLDDLSTPFGEMPELQQPGELENEMPTPQDGQPLRPGTLQQPADREPFDTAPRQFPLPGEFQPSVPPRVAPAPGDDFVPTAPPEAVELDRERADAACTDSLNKLRENTIDKLSLSITVTGAEGTDYPFECTIDDGTWHAGRAWPQTTYLWKASALCHKPLYFEDEYLERYGHSWPGCWQPFVSGAHFFTRLPVLPYCMGVTPPMECEYALGHYRPGSCAPYLVNPVPISARGALFQAGAVAGAVALP